MLWKALRRQRVPWEAALALAAAQLACLPPVQRAFVERGTQGRPWSFSRAVIASWDVQDPALVPLYRRLAQCPTVVAMSQAVAAALGERPELLQVLPVPISVLQHLYRLALGEDAGDAEVASVALSLTRRLALLGGDAISTQAKEELTMSHARLLGLAGDWAAALTVVTSSGNTRLTGKHAFATFVKERELHAAGAALPRAQVPTAIRRAPEWRAAAALLAHFNDADEAKAAFLSREDVSGAGAADALPWQQQLALFRSLAPAAQTYALLRPILARVPVSDPSLIVASAGALTEVAARMYAGTLTRRVHAFVKRGDVPAAVALCCAAGYYDLASALVPASTQRRPPPMGTRAAPAAKILPSFPLPPRRPQRHRTRAPRPPVVYDLPTDLLLYMKTASLLRQPKPPPSAAATAGGPAVGALGPGTPLAELLAHALHGPWQPLVTLLQVHAPGNERLRSLVAARARSSGPTAGYEALGEVHCYTFASPQISRLVCGLAAAKERRYFLKVIPGATRAHHVEEEPVPTVSIDAHGAPSVMASAFKAGGVPTPATADGPGLFESVTGVSSNLSFSLSSPYPPSSAAAAADSPPLIETIDECNDLLRSIMAHLRSGPAAPTGVALLKAVARACASGCVRLGPADSCGLPLATLTAGWTLRGGGDTSQRLDAMASTAAFQSVPSHFLDRCAPAVAAGVGGLLLSGNARVAAAVYSRWTRKVTEGTEDISQTAPARGEPAGSRHVADVFLQAAYYMSSRERRLHWAQRVWRDHRRPNALLLQELLVGDTRGTAAVLEAPRNSDGRGKRSGAPSPLSRRERRAVMGMAFSILSTEPSLEYVVRAGGQRRVTAEDVDEHGFHRLVRALPGPTALAAVQQLHAAGEAVEELWALTILCKADHASPLAAAEALLPLLPHSELLHCGATLQLALGGDAPPGSECNPLLALGAVLRFAVLSTSPPYKNSVRALDAVLCVLLRRFSESDCAVIALTALEGKRVAAANRLSRRIFNHLLHRPDLESVLLRERRDMWGLLGDPDPASPALLLGWLHHVLARRLHVPVAAAFTAHLLKLAATQTRDWRAALHFYSWLRRPTLEEGLLLLQGLRHSPDDASARVRRQLRLLAADAELAVVWADEGALTFAEKLALSEAILKAQAHTEERPNAFIAAPVRGAVGRWTMKECTRAQRLLCQLQLVAAGPANDDGGETFVPLAKERRPLAVFDLIEARRSQLDKVAGPLRRAVVHLCSA